MAAVTPIGTPTPVLQRRISTLVRMLMVRDGLNQGQLGERIGLDHTTVSAKLRGVSRWSVEDLDRLGEVFRVHPGEFWADPKDFSPGLKKLDEPSTRWYSPPARAA